MVDTQTRGEALPKDVQKQGPEPTTAAFDSAESTKARALLEAMAKAARSHQSLQIPVELAKENKISRIVWMPWRPSGTSTTPGAKAG